MNILDYVLEKLSKKKKEQRQLEASEAPQYDNNVENNLSPKYNILEGLERVENKHRGIEEGRKQAESQRGAQYAGMGSEIGKNITSYDTQEMGDEAAMGRQKTQLESTKERQREQIEATEKLVMLKLAAEKELPAAFKEQDKKAASQIEENRIKLLAGEEALMHADKLKRIRKESPPSYLAKLGMPSREQSAHDKIMESFAWSMLKAKAGANPTDAERKAVLNTLPQYSDTDLVYTEKMNNLEEAEQKKIQEIKKQNEYFEQFGTLRGYAKTKQDNGQNIKIKKDTEQKLDIPIIDDVEGKNRIANPLTKKKVLSKMENATGFDEDVVKSGIAGVGQSLLNTGHGIGKLVTNPIYAAQGKKNTLFRGKPADIKVKNKIAKEYGEILGDIVQMVGGTGVVKATGKIGAKIAPKLSTQMGINAGIAGAQGVNEGKGLENAGTAAALTGVIGGAAKGVGKGAKYIKEIGEKVGAKMPELELLKKMGVSPDVSSIVSPTKTPSKLYELSTKVPVVGGTNMQKIVGKSNETGEKLIENMTAGIDRQRKPAELLGEQVRAGYKAAKEPYNKQYEELFARANVVVPKSKLPLIVKDFVGLYEKQTREKLKVYTLKDVHNLRSLIGQELGRAVKNPNSTYMAIEGLKKTQQQLDGFIEKTLQSVPRGLKKEYDMITARYKNDVAPYKAKEAIKVSKGLEDYSATLPKALREQKTPEMKALYGKLNQESKTLLGLDAIYGKGSTDVFTSSNKLLNGLNKIASKERNMLFTPEQKELYKQLSAIEPYAVKLRPKITTPETGKSVVDIGAGIGAGIGLYKSPIKAAAVIGSAGIYRKLMENPILFTNKNLVKYLNKAANNEKYAEVLTKLLISLNKDSQAPRAN